VTPERVMYESKSPSRDSFSPVYPPSKNFGIKGNLANPQKESENIVIVKPTQALREYKDNHHSPSQDRLAAPSHKDSFHDKYSAFSPPHTPTKPKHPHNIKEEEFSFKKEIIPEKPPISPVKPLILPIP
jgi:hypothetical protein